MNVPPYVIFGDRTLNDIAEKKPKIESELFGVHGLSEKKIEKYADEILKIVGE